MNTINNSTGSDMYLYLWIVFDIMQSYRIRIYIMEMFSQ